MKIESGRSQDYYIEFTRNYFAKMDDIKDELKPEIKRQIKAAASGDHTAKQFLALQLEAHFQYHKIELKEPLYPNVPVYLSYIYKTYGQLHLDAVLLQSPYIENIWIYENRPIEYKEKGILKSYNYIPSSEEMDTLLSDLAHLSGGSIHQKRPSLSGDLQKFNARIQMYTVPLSKRSVTVRRHDKGGMTLRTMKMDEDVRSLLIQIALSNASSIVAGGMDVGKTTLVRAMIIEKNPDTNTLTTIEQIPELRIDEHWGRVVTPMYYVEGMPYETLFGLAFRNGTRSLAQGESRYGFEAFYVLESALRAPGFTITSVHIKLVSERQAMRTFEGLVAQYRNEDRKGIRQNISDGIEFFIMQEMNYTTGERYPSSIFCPVFNEETEELDAVTLVYFDKENGVYKWTGEKIPESKRNAFLQSPEVNIDELIRLGVW